MKTVNLLHWGTLTLVLCIMLSITASAQRGVKLVSNNSYNGGTITKQPSNSTTKVEGPHIKYSVQMIKHTLRPDNPEKIGGAEVKLYNKYKNSTEVVTASKEGKVILYLEPSTTYQITVNKQGYRPRFIKVAVKTLNGSSTESATIMLSEERQSMF